MLIFVGGAELETRSRVVEVALSAAVDVDGPTVADVVALIILEERWRGIEVDDDVGGVEDEVGAEADGNVDDVEDEVGVEADGGVENAEDEVSVEDELV